MSISNFMIIQFFTKETKTINILVNP